MLISFPSRRKLLATASDSSPGPKGGEAGSWQCLGPCLMSPGKLGNIYLPSTARTSPIPGACPCLRGNLPSGTATHLLILPLLPLLLGWCLRSSSLTPKGPASTDFSLGSEQRGLGIALTLMQKLEGPLIPRNLSITSNFVSPAVAKDYSRIGWHYPRMCPDLAPSLPQPQSTLQKQL